MTKNILNQVNFLRCQWLEDFNKFPILEKPKLVTKAYSLRAKYFHKIDFKIKKILFPLPLSQKFKGETNAWFEEYLSGIASLIADYKAIEDVTPDLTAYAEEFLNDFEDVGGGAPQDMFKKQLILLCDGMAKETFKGKADGYPPEIAYSLAKFGILNINKCDYRKESCLDSDCLREKLKRCYKEHAEIRKRQGKSTSKNIFTDLDDTKLSPECLSGNAQITNCIKCRKKINEIANDIKLRRADYSYLADDTFEKQLKVLWQLEYPRFNPCPKATKQVYECISENNDMWRRCNQIDWDNPGTIKSYTKRYSTSRKKNKTNTIKEIVRLSGKSKRAIIQSIYRKKHR